MGHRLVYNPFIPSGIHQHNSNCSPVEQHTPMVASGNTPPFVAPMDTTRVGVHSDPRWNSGVRSNEYHSSNISMEAQHLPPYSYTRSQIPGNTSLTPVTPVDGLNSTSANGGRPFKRKLPGTSGSGERGSSNNVCGAGSSSGSHMEKPVVDRHSLPPYRGASLSIGGEDSMRNVRNRSILELTRTNAPSYTPHHYQGTSHSANYSAPPHPVNLNADVTSREWNSVPHYAVSSHGWTSPPDINGPRHETSQFYAGGSSVDVDASHHDPFFRRNHVPSSQLPHVSHAQSTRDRHSYHSRRVTPSYGSGPSFSYYAHGGSSSTSEPQFPMENFFSTYSRHPSAGGSSSGYRNARPIQPFADMMDPHDRPRHEQTLMVDRVSFYNSSRNMLDEYQDMRLDVDSMSYEELLALEETMGDVSTGLSEDMMSKCLREQIYSCVDGNHLEATCPICLEEYKNGEKVGRMENCGHDFHIDCIKKWLLMKKLCPICKSECSPQP